MATKSICLIPECHKPVRGYGYCNAHYLRLVRHGDPLGGGTSKGELLRWVHEVALHHVGDDCLHWPYGNYGNGYGQFTIHGKKTSAHRYICELANGEPPTPEHDAAHNCGNGREGCIAPGHLEWKTPAENMADKLVHDTHQRGERQWNAKLTEANAREVLGLKGIESQHSLAARFGVARQTISSIHVGRTWSWLTCQRSTV
jgi:hypothetical protein